jgi:hypothetical protein
MGGLRFQGKSGGTMARPAQRRSGRRSAKVSRGKLVSLRPGDRVTWRSAFGGPGHHGVVERTLPDEMLDIIEDGTEGRLSWRLRLVDLVPIR